MNGRRWRWDELRIFENYDRVEGEEYPFAALSFFGSRLEISETNFSLRILQVCFFELLVSIMKRRNFVDYAWINKFLLHACGVLPLKTRSFFVNVVLVVTPFVTTCFLSLPAFYSLTFRWNTIPGNERMDLISEHIETIVALIKVLVLLPKREKMFGLTRSCSNLWKSVELPEDFAAVEPYAIKGLYLTYGFTFNVSFALVTFLISPLMSSFVVDANGTVLVSKQLPYGTGMFHDNVRQFNIWYGLQIPSGIISITPIIAIDTATAFFILHACAHMRLCRVLFRKVAHDSATERPLAIFDDDWSEKKEKILQDIVRCVTHHRNVLRYSQDIEDVFAPVFLIQMLLSMSAICGYGYNLLLEEELKGRISYLVHLVGGTLQLLIFCWPPDNLEDESIMVADAAYDVPWYDWSSREGNLVSTIMTRSQKPASVTAGKFTIVSLKTFSSILSTAFSMFTLLRRVVE